MRPEAYIVVRTTDLHVREIAMKGPTVAFEPKSVSFGPKQHWSDAPPSHFDRSLEDRQWCGPWEPFAAYSDMVWWRRPYERVITVELL